MTVQTRVDRRAVPVHDDLDAGQRVSGAADSHFGCVVRSFSTMFPARRFGGGALAVYLDGQPVVDVWTGWSDRGGHRPWSADSAPMVFSATKGMAATVIHRLADRGLIDYDAPVAEYWPEFAANGKASLTVRDVMRHAAGLSGLRGASTEDLLDHVVMEERLAAAAPGRLLGKPAYHALTFGWLMSGLARALTGKGMQALIREELAEPLRTDGLYLGRPPAGAPTRVAQIVAPQNLVRNPVLSCVTRKVANQLSGGFRSMYFPGMVAAVQGDIPLLDAEIPAANGVATARGLARMYGAIANGGEVDGIRFLSREMVAGLTGRRSLRPDRNLFVPLAFHLGYHSLPIGNVMPGFGHVGLGGSLGWTDPASGVAFSLVHNRLLTPFVMTDHAAFVGIYALIRKAAEKARKRGFEPVTEYGAPYYQPGAVAG
ncbi:serine hydrolase domain-containing protein [Mycobacterium nebraskense]|uniref:Esterase n=1 Tax=Mycobacterium nebraskense TaxID=244292 RepID=A0A1X1Z026_9MYCO|nr:serine hydrolase domain-containing protein [Mycobacterium nebraskense]KKC05497.1 esterase [Mycobacterium nebraskense]MBI2694390.1 beta-lactamase family protein [Mycobacterium nebraskense]MCV7118921.1 beta-lactamase family protein [Mycobacterium nebraskense]ORW16697.1 esterase [Mycobacterium nebraskense]